jgi:hypothetical protein
MAADYVNLFLMSHGSVVYVLTVAIDLLVLWQSAILLPTENKEVHI